MGTHVIKMPDIGEGIAEVELVEWHVQVGDEVHEDQLLAEVMTDKATVEIPSPVAGTIVALGGVPGQVMAVGGELIRLEVEGHGNHREAAQPKPHDEAPAAMPEAKPAPVAEAPKPAPRVESKPVAPAARPAPSPAPRRAPGEKPLASPAVRQRARDLGVELQFVQGSGPAGRILREDLEHFLEHGGATIASGYTARHDEHQIPVIGLRRKIAQKMAEAKRRIPHFSYVEEIDVTDLEDLRVHLNAKHSAARGKLTLLPFIARAMVVALRDFPQLNARYDDDADVITRYGAVHLGVATQSDNGLMVPVLRNAESRDLWGNSAEVARLAEAARHGKASREELSGSTITLSSLGALGGIVSTPVINYPEVAIVGVNRMVERPMVVNGQIVVRKMMNLSSSFDHRVVDGMDAAAFIQAVRALLEHPATLFID